jgi:hypothetical protein
MFMQAGLAQTGGRMAQAGHELQEYLLVACPNAVVGADIEDIAQAFYADYGVQPAAAIKPHIQVAGFQAREVMEETVIRWIARICQRQKSFLVTLNNYSGFPPHTIYLRVQDPCPFIVLGRELKAVDELIRSSSCPPAQLVARPWLGIASLLPEQVYMKAMPDYSGKTFHASFMVNELLLLRKDTVSGACKTINIFKLPPADHVSFGEVA